MKFGQNGLQFEQKLFNFHWCGFSRQGGYLLELLPQGDAVFNFGENLADPFQKVFKVVFLLSQGFDNFADFGTAAVDEPVLLGQRVRLQQACEAEEPEELLAKGFIVSPVEGGGVYC